MAKRNTGNPDFSKSVIEPPGVGVHVVTPRQLVASLRSEVCPMCGGAKASGHTLCRREYRALPHGMKMALYDRLGAGYEEAVKNAFGWRDATTFILPA